MSLAGDCGGRESHASRAGGGEGWELYNEVQCIVGNGHVGTPCGQTDRQKHATENITLP